MAKTIKFSVHRNPLKNEEGKDTYQVRHESYYTAHKADLLEHIKRHTTIRPELIEMTLSVLREEIVEFLIDNKRLHIEGLGTFYLKVGFKKQCDEWGNEQKPNFTNPADITGHNVCVETIGFTPDKAFLTIMEEKDYGFENITGRGKVGHSNIYEYGEITQLINDYLEKRGKITRKEMMSTFGLTRHATAKWIDLLTESPNAFLESEKIGNTTVYYRCKK